MPFDLSEKAILHRLAHLRWGPTGFCCRVCKHPHGRPVRGRPRVRVCARPGCRAQTSITAGTLLHGAKVPLVVWVLRGEMLEGYEAKEIPTSSEAAELFEIARSTAWAMNQKVAACAGIYQEGFNKGFVHTGAATLPLRTPKSEYLGMLRRVLAELREAREANLAIILNRFTVALGRVGIDRDEAIRLRRQQFMIEPSHHTGVGVWLANHLRHRHGPVSLRWLPRWVDALLFVYNRLFDPMSPFAPSWWQLVIAAGPRPLCALDPWLERH